MFSPKLKNGLLSLLVVLLLVGGLVLYENQSVSSETTKTLDDVLISAGSCLRDNNFLLSQSLKYVGGNDCPEDKTVAWVNGIPISIDELNFRKALKEQINPSTASYPNVFNILVEEKLVLASAKKANIVPTDAEVQEFIAFEQNQYNTDAEYRDGVDKLCKQANMAIDEYWTTYEWYNAFRLLTHKNVFNNKCNQGIQTGDLNLNNDNNTSLEQVQKAEYWKKAKLDLKAEADVRINDKFKDLQLEKDLKLYSFGN